MNAAVHQDSSTILFKSWLTGGVANAIASSVLNPLDVVKTRMQCQTTQHTRTLNHSTPSQLSMVRTFSQMYREGGLIGLWRPGLAASCVREMLSSGPRAGFYVPIRDICLSITGRSSEGDLVCKIAAAMTCGTLGAVVANPIDVVKIRLMVSPTLYPSIITGLISIYSNQGIAGLYAGLIPSTLRSAFIAAGELATYDIIKTQLRRVLKRDDFMIHIASSLITGVVAAVVAAPFDLLKARAMNGSNNKPSSRLLYLARDMVSKEGFLVLFRGVVPAYMRLGPHALLCFPILEELRRTAGLDYL